jgi:peptidoglycan-associated lipoprotein
MKRQILIGAVGIAVALSGCSKKQAPISAGEAPAENAYSSPDTGTGQRTASGLQEDLIATVGTDRVLFETDSSSLSREAQQILAAQVSWLNRHPSVAFTIEGHCDERGTREYNLALGERRAAAVANFLTLKGISPARINTISYGKERPEETGSDELAWAKNRRAVSIVVDSGG